jgi:hypothetical protein
VCLDPDEDATKGRFKRFLSTAAQEICAGGFTLLGLWLANRFAQPPSAPASDGALARYEGNGDTNTAPFVAYGPWQIFRWGNLEIRVHDVENGAIGNNYVSGVDGTAYFPMPGKFFLLITSRSNTQ